MSGGIFGKLTDIRIRAFISKAAPGKKLADGGGLYLVVSRTRCASWRIKYRVDGKERVYTVGQYPLVSLAAARTALREVKAQLLEHKDPMVERRLHRAAAAASIQTTFKAVAELWLAMKQREWSAIHYKKSARAFERDVYPSLGNLPIASVTPTIAAKTIEDIHKRDVLETALRILQHVNGVFRYAQAKGLCQHNPALPVREVLPRKRHSGRMPALLTFPELGDVLRRAEMAHLSPSVRMAHRLLAFTAARIGNVVDADWREFLLDADQPVWIIPRKKMKVAARDIDHRIPLCPAIAQELRDWREKVGRRGRVFPSPSGTRHISRESLEKVYRVTLELSGKHSPHGWRSAFSTLARDEGFARDVVELALDHAHDNEVARAYDRGERFTQRVQLFNWWGTQLSEAQRGAKVIAMPRKSGSGVD